MEKTNMNENDWLESVIAEISTMDADQIAELRENVESKHSESLSHTLDVVLRTVAILRLFDAINSLEPLRRGDALEFAIRSLLLIGEMRGKGASNSEIALAVDEFAKTSLDERKNI